MQEFQADCKSIEINHFYLNFKEDNYFIKTDKRRLQQIVLNLLSNALKFTGKNGKIDIVVSIERQDTELSDTVSQKRLINRKACIVKVEVKDNGPGISKRDQKKLFKLFGKLKSTDQVNTNGIGLGLCICKRIC